MLLFVMRAEFDDLGDCGIEATGHQLEHFLVDMIAIIGNLSNGRASNEATLRSWVARADCLVVAVVEKAVLGPIPHAAACAVGAQYKLGEEPRGVRPVPLRRAGVGHRLHDLVFGA